MALVAVVCVAAPMAPATVWAQAKNQSEPTPEEQKGYTLPYFFTLAGAMAVIIALCTPTVRKWDVGGKGEE